MVPSVRLVWLPLEDAGKLISPGPAGHPGLAVLSPAVQEQAQEAAETAAIPHSLSGPGWCHGQPRTVGGEPRAP